MNRLNLQSNILRFNDLDSTNDYAHQLLKEKKAEEGTVILADFQRNGKGQRENYWESETGKNLTFSFVLRPNSLPAQKQFYLSMAVSLGILKYLESESLKALIKWPNDIYIDRKKIAGILIENSLNRDKIDYSVIGIGLNVNQVNFLSDAPNPTSVLLEKKQSLNLEEALYYLLQDLEYWMEPLYDNRFEIIHDHYLQHLMLFEKLSTFSAQKRSFKGVIKDVKETGELVMELEDGRLESFMFKEISFPY